MSAVILMMSKSGMYERGLIRGNPESVKNVDIEDVESEAWKDTGLRPVRRTPKEAAKDSYRLLVVTSRVPVFLVQCTYNQTPEQAEASAVPIPVAEDGITSYSCILHPDTRSVWVKGPPLPAEEPSRPWYLAWWPF